MLVDAVLWLASIAVVLLAVTIGVRVGTALARVKNVSFARCFGVATLLLVVETVFVAVYMFGTSQFGGARAAVFGFGGMILGIAVPILVVKKIFAEGWGRTIIVWADGGLVRWPQ